MKWVIRNLALYSLAMSVVSSAARAAEPATPSPEKLKFFETSIRPLFVEHCSECHGAKKQWGSLRLDSRESILKGGDSGAVIVPGKPEESLLIQAVSQTDDNLRMPPQPKARLTARQVADLTRWVKEGAVFPADAAKTANVRTRDPNHWSFRPPVSVDLPSVKNAAWTQSPIDRFVLARLEAAGLAPAAPADRRTLLRRVTFDLTGLPPTPEEIEAFLSDERPDAFARVVDRLLDSPSYGERWGRHWLDVARYADSNGLDENVCFGNAWRYRDWVVNAFNSDVPFDQFLTEQLAGDLLPTDDQPTRNERLTATGFLALGAKVLAEVDAKKMEMDIIDEQVESIGRTFLGMTFGCARCHDHKFDPISTADYYGLAGVFKSTKTMENFIKVAKWHENEIPTPESEAVKAAYQAKLAERKAAIQKVVDEANATLKAASSNAALPEKPEEKYPDATKAQLKKLRDELAAFEKTAPEPRSALGVTDLAGVDLPIHVRGSHLKLGDVVARRVPEVFPARPTEFPKASSGRLELARWLTSPNNPLTARVLVNRVWRWHFGKGIVPSVDNFGLLGEKPTHPELLDWLAMEVQGKGAAGDEKRSPGAWSMKRLHRLILLSATYQQSSAAPEGSMEKDPENRLYGRADVRRLEAEEVRDALMAVGGRLDRTFGGTLLSHVKNRGYFFDHTSKDLTDYTTWRRSVYLPIVRNNVYDVFQLLDFPDPAVPTGSRASTTVAPQALLMMNSDLVSTCSTELAGRVAREMPTDEARRLRLLYTLSFGRNPSDAEAATAREFLAAIEQATSASETDAAKRRQRAWEVLAQTLLASNEFIYVN